MTFEGIRPMLSLLRRVSFGWRREVKAKEEHQIDFENEGGETFICGNPPYLGSKWQSKVQKEDLANAWRKHPKLAKNHQKSS